MDKYTFGVSTQDSVENYGMKFNQIIHEKSDSVFSHFSGSFTGFPPKWDKYTFSVLLKILWISLVTFLTIFYRFQVFHTLHGAIGV